MAGTLLINQTAVETDSQIMKGAWAGLSFGHLAVTDDESTILANGRAKETFFDAQNAIVCLSRVLSNETENIKSLGQEFAKLDEQYSNLIKNQ